MTRCEASRVRQTSMASRAWAPCRLDLFKRPRRFLLHCGRISLTLVCFALLGGDRHALQVSFRHERTRSMQAQSASRTQLDDVADALLLAWRHRLAAIEDRLERLIFLSKAGADAQMAIDIVEP